jgi:hypothetical protein
MPLRNMVCLFLCLLLTANVEGEAGRRRTKRPTSKRERGLVHQDRKGLKSCDLIMTVFSRWQTLGDRLTHYQHLPEASSILVIVNNQNVTLAHLPRADAYAVNVVYKFMETNSMNNRFFPWPELKNDCILIVDDDVDADLAAMSTAIHVWKKSENRDRLVGFSECGRNHFRSSASGNYTYCARNCWPGGFAASMVLPGCGIVFHKQVLMWYSFATPQSARDLVDQTMNGDDILLNFVAANHTGTCPIALESGTVRFITKLSSSGLSARTTHYTDKSRIINELVSIFGRIPLSYNVRLYGSMTDVGRLSVCYASAPRDLQSNLRCSH